MCAHSPASAALAGWTLLARGLDQRRPGRLCEPVDLESRSQPSQLSRDREIAPHVTEADRRRDEEGALRARGDAPPARRGWRKQRLAEQKIDPHRVAQVGRMAAAFHRHEPSTGLRRQLCAIGVMADAVLVAVDDEDGAPHAACELPRLGLVQPRGTDRLDERSRRSSRSPIRRPSRSAAWNAAPGTSCRRTTRRSPRSRAASSSG